jgi:hypothetical protein
METGKRGVDVMTLRKIAVALDTFPEVLNEQRDLSKDEIIKLNQTVHILTDKKDPRHKALMELLGTH